MINNGHGMESFSIASLTGMGYTSVRAMHVCLQSMIRGWQPLPFCNIMYLIVRRICQVWHGCVCASQFRWI